MDSKDVEAAIDKAMSKLDADFAARLVLIEKEATKESLAIQDQLNAERDKHLLVANELALTKKELKDLAAATGYQHPSVSSGGAQKLASHPRPRNNQC